ncbi:MAG: beta-eliminating lyase-related protein [Alphaproteobacteria bacterium]
MQFNSDNWSGAHPDIVAAIAEEAARDGGAYGSSPVDLALNGRFSNLFETDVQVFPVASGTAANSLALAACGRPGGIVLCHSESHVEIDECGAVGLQGDGLRLRLIDGPGGKMQAADLAATIAAFPKGHVHAGQRVALSLTQMSEAATCYSLDELRGLSARADDAGLAVHIDVAVGDRYPVLRRDKERLRHGRCRRGVRSLAGPDPPVPADAGRASAFQIAVYRGAI